LTKAKTNYNDNMGVRVGGFFAS